jgi:hypothetical protein
MRTTLDIDDDLLHAAKEMARRDGSTAGEVVSTLLRRALTGLASERSPAAYRVERELGVAGFVPFPARPGVVTTDDQVNRLRDTEGV